MSYTSTGGGAFLQLMEGIPLPGIEALTEKAVKTRIPILAGNWKMHLTIAEATALALELRAGCAGLAGREVIVAPVFTALAPVAAALAGGPIRVAAQDSHWEEKGAFTGEVSGSLLKDAGCTAVIIGHSERRQLFGETDEQVNRKTLAALRNGLLPIVCVGETLAERESGAVEQVIGRQVRGALAGLAPDQVAALAVAYEPVWAIGTGRTATPAQANEVHGFIRGLLSRARWRYRSWPGPHPLRGQRETRQRRRTHARARARRRARGGSGPSGCVFPAHRELPGVRNPGQATERERTEHPCTH